MSIDFVPFFGQYFSNIFISPLTPHFPPNTKTYVSDFHKNYLNETTVLSAHSIGIHEGEKKVLKFCLCVVKYLISPNEYKTELQCMLAILKRISVINEIKKFQRQPKLNFLLKCPPQDPSDNPCKKDFFDMFVSDDKANSVST